MSQSKLSECFVAARATLADDEAPAVKGALEVLESQGIGTVSQLLGVIADQSAAPEMRARAAGLAADLGIADAVPTLVNALGTETDGRLVWSAANALVRLRARESGAALVVIADKGSRERQTAVLWTLGALRATVAIPLLRRIAVDEQADIDVRAHALEALGAVGASEAANDLLAVLSSPSPELRFWACYSLGQVGDAESIPQLEQLARVDLGVSAAGRAIGNEARDAVESIRMRLEWERPS